MQRMLCFVLIAVTNGKRRAAEICQHQGPGWTRLEGRLRLPRSLAQGNTDDGPHLASCGTGTIKQNKISSVRFALKF
eukprot:10526419-Ditylum_brightwellii.AAC.1